MPDSPEGRPPVAKWQLGAVPDGEKNLPPWERSNPSYAVGAGKDEKSVISVSARLTAKEHRDLQKIVQHRKFPAIENKSDAMRTALMMLRYWYGIHHDEAMREQLDVEMWENERIARTRERIRVIAILDALEVEMKEAKRLGYENRLRELLAELKKYKVKLTDEELKGKANVLYVDYFTKPT